MKGRTSLTGDPWRKGGATKPRSVRRGRRGSQNTELLRSRAETVPKWLGRRLALRIGSRKRVSARPERQRGQLDHELRELARARGIQTFYVDMAGARKVASPETLREILRLFGVPAGTGAEIRESLSEGQEQQRRQLLPPTIVVWDGVARKLDLRLPTEKAHARIASKLHFEDGRCKGIDLVAGSARSYGRNLNGTYAARLELPELPFGYHRLELEQAGRLNQSLIISAPVRSYSPSTSSRAWGSFLPLYAARSGRNWGVGDLSDARALADWTASNGGGVIGMLPLLSSFLDRPVSEPSPYSPASRLFWNEFYLDVERLPEFAGCDPARKLVNSRAFREKLNDFRAAPLIEYQAQMAAKRRVLELLAEVFFKSDSARRREFDAFVRARQLVGDYAEFRATGDFKGKSWPHWEERMRNGKLQPGDWLESARRYHLYVQWVAEGQMGELSSHCRDRGVRLYLDMPVGTHPDGYDLWRQRDLFAFTASAGAPPDPFFPNGQNWGFTPLHPERLRQRGYGYFIDLLRFQMRHADLLRMDHVPGLHRLFWIPPGAPPEMGAYVSYPAEELYALVCLESHRQQTIIAGENLGTVPPEVNETMDRHQLRQTYVLQYQQRPTKTGALTTPPALSIASINTHDMPPFAAHWEGKDIQDRARLSVLPQKNLAEEWKRRRLNSALARFLQHRRVLDSGTSDALSVVKACLSWLAASPAETVLVNLEDLWSEKEWQNLPGTTTAHPNWRRKASKSLEQIESSADLRDFLRRLSQIRKSSAKAGKARLEKVPGPMR